MTINLKLNRATLNKFFVTCGTGVLASAFLISFPGCSNKSTVTVAESSSDEAAMKAAAEAEAAEESMATEKIAKKAAGKTALKSARNVASKESIFVVQVGTFKVEANAKSLAEKLKSTGLPVFQKKIERSDGEVFYAVRIEPTPSRAEAEKFAATVKSAVGATSLILSVGR